jgi:hypothetical protein
MKVFYLIVTTALVFAVYTKLRRAAGSAPGQGIRTTYQEGDSATGAKPVLSAGAASPVAAPPLTERQRLRNREELRAKFTERYGEARSYHALVLQHLKGGSILMGVNSRTGDFILAGHPDPVEFANGTFVDFYGWSTGTETYETVSGSTRTLPRLLYTTPPIPIWNKYGSPINRDIYVPPTRGLNPAAWRERQEHSTANPLEQRAYKVK